MDRGDLYDIYNHSGHKPSHSKEQHRHAITPYLKPGQHVYSIKVNGVYAAEATDHLNAACDIADRYWSEGCNVVEVVDETMRKHYTRRVGK